MKNSKIMVAAALAGLLSVGGFANYGHAEFAEPDSSNSTQVIEPAAIKPGTWASAGFKIIKYASNTWLFHREATKSVTAEAITLSTGDIGFNNNGGSGYGASTKFQVYVNEIGQLIDAWPETNILNYLEKLSIIITDEQKGTDVVSKTATHQQHIMYTANHHGYYTVRWVDEDKMKWDLWLNVWDKAYGGIGTSSATQIHTLENAAGDQIKAKKINGSYYFIPSTDHKSSQKFDENKSLSMIDIQNQLYDNVLQKDVNQFKNYNVGDKLTLDDSIQSIEYDTQTNSTIIGFKGKDDALVRWAFNGDLTKEYAEGDVLKLKLTVVTEASEFESLDFIQEATSNTKAPEITDYLVK